MLPPNLSGPQKGSSIFVYEQHLLDSVNLLNCLQCATFGRLILDDGGYLLLQEDFSWSVVKTPLFAKKSCQIIIAPVIGFSQSLLLQDSEHDSWPEAQQPTKGRMSLGPGDFVSGPGKFQRWTVAKPRGGDAGVPGIPLWENTSSHSTLQKRSVIH